MLDRIEDSELRQQLAYEALYGMWYRSRPDTVEWIQEETTRLAKAHGKARDASFWATAINQSAEVSNIPRIVEWAASENSDAHRKIFASLAGKWAGSDPAEARRWFSENAVRLDAKSIEEMRDVFENLAFADLAGTKPWVDTLPAGPLQDRARFQLALDSGAKGDLAQVQTVYASIFPRDSEGKLAKQVAAMLAKRDGTAAADWAMRLPGGAARATAIESVAAEWTKHDLPGVRAWLEAMPEGAERDATMMEYAAKVGYNDPQAGAACVERIADAGIREKAASHVYWSWRNEDPAGARAWVQNLGGMSERWKANLLKQPK